MREIAGSQILNARDMQSIAAITAGKAVQRYPLYSVLDVPAAGVTELSFFSTPLGGTQTVGALTITMDKSRTNITKANSVSTPNDFILKAIRLFVYPLVAEVNKQTAAAMDDMMLLLQAGYFKLVFGEREHLSCPPMMLSAGMGLNGFTGLTGGNAVSNSHPLLFKVEPWVLIPSELIFQATLNWATAPNISATARVGLIFDGDLVRNVA
jgi:hypothetical protein